MRPPDFEIEARLRADRLRVRVAPRTTSESYGAVLTRDEQRVSVPGATGGPDDGADVTKRLVGEVNAGREPH